ncbi:Putative Zinc finger, RING-type [Septoria linicola]|uniref:Zinc finger, RING-type n=1 Tax=Septoria linicola TaxID=215465 RepID=A0A9Q9AGP9_9PEZI|nr:Putative Zinc finger, RING-type [Septoria linicola]
MRATYYRRYSWHDEGYAEALAETKQDLELKYKFPPTRHPEYETVLLARGEMAIVDNHNIPEAYHRCPVCLEDFDETHAAVSVPCGNPRHFACRECLLDQIHYQGTDQARCGPCNVFFFPNKSGRDYLKYGLLEGAYINDSRFAEWENMQRSCSDLDRYLTTSSTVVTDAFGTGKICDRSITINYPDMIAQIWLRMVDLDSTIPAIPRRRAINTPDFRYVARMFMSGIFTLTGRTMTNKQLFEYLKAHINQGLIWRCGRVAGPQFLGEERYEQLTHAPVTIAWKVKNDLQIYRDGLEEFVDRSLHRTLNFIRLRYCCCGPAPNLTWSSADLQHASFHWHGGRLFWDPRHFKRLLPIRREHGVNNFYKVYNTVPSPGAIHKPSDWKKKTPWRRSH